MDWGEGHGGGLGQGEGWTEELRTQEYKRCFVCNGKAGIIIISSKCDHVMCLDNIAFFLSRCTALLTA